MPTESHVQFKGYAMTDPSNWSDLKILEFKPKNFEPEDVEIAITYCGVCGSDVHTLTQGWGQSKLPIVVGHEIVGVVTRVGDKVTEFKPGDIAGVGAQRGSCLSCRPCDEGLENYCMKGVNTYNAEYPDGVIAQGGYSTAIRANQRFVFAIPKEIEPKHAASMMCGGLTVFSPLKANGCGPGKKVGVVGIGGLGHYAILFAKAMGAEVYAFTHSPRKADDIKKMGADHIVDTEQPEFWKEYTQTLDIIIMTRNVFGPNMPLDGFLSMLYVRGQIVFVGLPDINDPLPPLHPISLVIPSGGSIGGSAIGNKTECLEMLALAAEKNIKPWIEELPMRDAGKALLNVKNNKVRYRYVLKQDIV